MSNIELQSLPRSSNQQTLRRLPSPVHHEEDPQNQLDQPARPPLPQMRAIPNSLSTTLRPLSEWWHSWISRTITHGSDLSNGDAHGDPRDYLALERTFLGWVRTSLTLISLGVVVTQLFIFQNLDRTKGIVLGCVLAAGGMVIVVGAAVRYFRSQELLVKGKALTGGWEAIGVWGLLVLVVGALFIIVLVEG